MVLPPKTRPLVFGMPSSDVKACAGESISSACKKLAIPFSSSRTLGSLKATPPRSRSKIE
ncbi:hypothetical protein LguiB_027226 [Lonicera macranthoides]